MKRLINFAFYCGDVVRIIAESSKYHGLIGEVHSIIVHIDEERKYYLDYVVLFNPAKGKFGNRERIFAANALEKVKRK